MICNELQDNLASLYDLNLPCQVQDYICHDELTIEQLTGRKKSSDEELLIQQANDTLEVTLFLSEHLLDSFTDTADYDSVGGSFDDYCTVLEGISHFVYLIWNAQYGRQIKPVEMELQAEVDKFVFSAEKNATFGVEAGRHVQEAGRSNHELNQLSDKLFQDIQFFPQQEPAIRQRYRTANALASNYCNWLSSHYRFSSGDPHLHAELARFYRLSGSRKFEHIRQL